MNVKYAIVMKKKKMKSDYNVGQIILFVMSVYRVI